MNRVAIATAASLVLAAIALAGCSARATGSRSAESGDAAARASGIADANAELPAQAAPIDVCALLSAEQASAIVGVHYASAQPSRDMCTYTPTDAPIGMFIIITPNARGDSAWHDALSTLQEDGGTPATITGVGDRAAGSGTQLDVQAGDRIIDVHGGDPDSGTGVFTTSVAVAKAIIAAMK